ncbi:hypothetical protein SMICM17S_06253 [Streptomyces microflavus]
MSWPGSMRCGSPTSSTVSLTPGPGRLVGNGDHFAMGYSYTHDDPDDMVTLIVLRALDEQAPSPFRVLVEEVAADVDTYTLREGGFNRLEDAWQRGATSGTAVRPLRSRRSGRSAPVGRRDRVRRRPPLLRPPSRKR